jgi:ribosome-binding factor A
MQETRRRRLESVIQDELATVIAREVKDPRVPTITLTSVQVTPDGGQATVSIAILGGAHGRLVNSVEGEQGTSAQDTAKDKEAQHKMKECIQGLNSASGYLRRHLASVLTVRHIPSLIFREDRGFENTIRVHELLKQITPAEKTEPKAESEPKPENDT